MVFGNGVKDIQAAAYNGACTVFEKALEDSGYVYRSTSDETDLRQPHQAVT